MRSLYAFVSRHKPTFEQLELCKEKGIVLEHIGDLDAFSIEAKDIYDKGAFEGVVVVHPAAALRLQQSFIIGVFENANRAEDGERPTFKAKRLHIFDNLD